ncbi:MAG TPA: TylF/MycF/NovP-related O-methyltransferase, partial [Paracoccaceae bacterium]|nr:TylF/MycF/NovP-related O-methyltransferase [Paracoccaceae bacterium]
IVESLDELADVAGFICEIGVARGMTSRFIVEHVTKMRMNLNFYPIDTFSSFTENDIEYEKSARGKKAHKYNEFKYNDYNAWSRNFSHFDFVRPIKADANVIDFAPLAPIKFVLLDVDFYKPTIRVLRDIREHLSERAIIIVDDVSPRNDKWDGAHQAFMEFVAENPEVQHRIYPHKCGFLRFCA